MEETSQNTIQGHSMTVQIPPYALELFKKSWAAGCGSWQFKHRPKVIAGEWVLFVTEIDGLEVRIARAKVCRIHRPTEKNKMYIMVYSLSSYEEYQAPEQLVLDIQIRKP